MGSKSILWILAILRGGVYGVMRPYGYRFLGRVSQPMITTKVTWLHPNVQVVTKNLWFLIRRKFIRLVNQER